MEHEDMRLISAFKFYECAESNNHAKRHLSPPNRNSRLSFIVAKLLTP